MFQTKPRLKTVMYVYVVRLLDNDIKAFKYSIA